MSNRETDAFQEEIERVDVKISQAIRAYLPKILPAFVVGAYSLFVLSKIPAKGLAAKYLFKFNIITPVEFFLAFIVIFILNKLTMGRKNILVTVLIAIAAILTLVYFQFGGIIIPYKAFQWVLGSLSLISLCGIIYYIIYAKTAVITANRRFVQLSHGVISRENDSTNLSKLQDEDMKQSTLDLILGLGRVILEVNRSKTVIFDKISAKDAQKLHKFIKAHAFGQSREYWMTRDRINDRINDDPANKYKYIEDGEGDNADDFDGGEGDGGE